MRPAQYSQPQYQDVGGLAPPISIRQFNGLNTYDPLSIDPSHFTDMLNMSSDDYPSVSTRMGYRTLISIRPIGMFYFRNVLHVVFADGSWRKYAGGNWITIALLLPTTNPWSFTTFQGEYDSPRIIAACGTNGIYISDGNSVSQLANAPSRANFVTTYQNRIWCMDDNELKACAVDSSTVWDRYNGGAGDSYARQIETPDGDGVTALHSASSFLLIGSRKSIQRLDGTDPTNFSTSLVTSEAGITGNDAIDTFSGISYFIGETGLYRYAGGTLPDRGFSEIINKRLQGFTVNPSIAVHEGTLYAGKTGSLTTYDLREGIGTFNEWRGIFETKLIVAKNDQNENKLFAGTGTGKVIVFDAEADDGAPIPWYVTTVPFSNASIAQKQRWYKLFITVEYTGSLQVFLSNKISGEEWDQVVSLNSSGEPETQRIIVPVQKYARENYIRIKIAGQGRAKIHEITREMRQLPLY